MHFENLLYGITIEGILFNEAGGYRQQREDIILQRERLKIENVRNRRVNRFLVVGSIAAGIGAIGLALIEIYKICHHIR